MQGLGFRWLGVQGSGSIVHLEHPLFVSTRMRKCFIILKPQVE